MIHQNVRISSVVPNQLVKTKYYEHITPDIGVKTTRRRQQQQQLQMVPTSELIDSMFGCTTTLLSAVEVFDASMIVDPVIVSNAFWGSLQTKILSVVIGQGIATVVFLGIATLATKQIANVVDFITETISRSIISTKTSTSDSSRIKEKYYVRPDFVKLAACLAIDTIGSSSVIIPILGDLSDLVWAPIAGILLRNLFYGSNVILALEVSEEILPFTDILPLATLCWIVDTIFWDTDLARILKLGRYKPIQYLNDNYIDTTSSTSSNKVIDVDNELKK